MVKNFFYMSRWKEFFVNTFMHMLSLSHHPLAGISLSSEDLISYHPYGLYHCPNISSSQYTVLRIISNNNKSFTVLLYNSRKNKSAS